MCFSWAHPWALERTPGPWKLSGKLPEQVALSLNLWAAGQGSWALTWLESTGKGWGRLDKAPGPGETQSTHRTLLNKVPAG